MEDKIKEIIDTTIFVVRDIDRWNKRARVEIKSCSESRFNGFVMKVYLTEEQISNCELFEDQVFKTFTSELKSHFESGKIPFPGMTFKKN